MIAGEKYGMLTCIGKDTSKDSRYYLFQCECGNVKSIIANNVKRGATKSCGCYFKEHPPHVTFGFSHTRIDNIYKTMINRCYSPNNNRYLCYGAKGITVCDEWKNDKIKFFEWAFNHGYRDDLTIDRIDNSKGYSPDNCRWVSYVEQANNRTNNRILTYQNRSMSAANWARELGIKSSLIYGRLRRGWDVSRTLSTPVMN